MQYLAIIGLFLLSYGCSHGENFNRGYVISQSNMESEHDSPPAEEPDFN